MRSLIVLSFAVVSMSVCDKLSTEMDQTRSETCGSVVENKAVTKTSTELTTPWTIRVLYQSSHNSTRFYRSAILISQRHVLTNSNALFVCKDTGCKEWKWVLDDSPVDTKKCKDNVMEIPKKMRKKMTVYLSVCSDKERCGTDIERSVVAVYYLGSCELGLAPFGMTLLEMSSNVPNDVDYFRPVCVADKTEAKTGDKVEVHAAGEERVRGSRKYIKSTPTEIVKCGSWRYDQQFCTKYAVCIDEFGGGVVKKIDGRQTLVGIVEKTDANCSASTVNTIVSVGHYKEKLCELTGICKESSGPTDSSGGKIGGFRSIILMTVWWAGFLSQ